MKQTPRSIVLALILVTAQNYLSAQSIRNDHDKHEPRSNKNNQSKNMKTKPLETSEIMRRFNDAFLRHDPSALPELIARDCVMESIQGPNGIRYEGYDACLDFWKALATDPNTHFDLEEIVVMGDRATIRWRYWWGEGESNSVRGVNLMRVQDGLIIEALGYSKRQ